MASTKTDSAGRPVAWKARDVEVVTTHEGDPIGFWYFAGEVEARNIAAQRMGRPPPYHLTGLRLPHPTYPHVLGAEWRDSRPREEARDRHRGDAEDGGAQETELRRGP